MKSHWAGLIEFFVAIAFALGWAVLELEGLRLDRKKAEREETERKTKPD